MINLIGEIAGRIWNYLDANGETTLTNLKKGLELKDSEVSMALGWLARENKVEVQKKGTTIKVQLLNK